MPNKIYVITCGDYSDYSVYGVTTDPDRAKQMRDIVSAHEHDEAEIEEYEDGVFENDRLNSIIPQEYWKVWLYNNRKPITHKYIADKNKETIYVTGGQKKGGWEDGPNGYPRREIYTEYFVSGIVAKDEEHAIKIAADKVAEYRAQEEVIT